ncbi:MAG: BBP7 family outer membrane beta-barrel protein, partial [Gemmataceae bacterium]
GARVGMQVNKTMRVSLGYNLLYMNNVIRPGRQIDTNINLRNVPLSNSFGTLSGDRFPRVRLDREDFYAHGATAAIEFVY